ncbi:fumarylacetoacetate hydrolase family protein [Sphingomonas colocasiae]|uniref:Fumarylacetoacetate hydrolase family protein n=1 Tax=Sphingomonas colocasiae TaxID=1848973 RepID=A0ABS7PHH0_9SPHN|nr:fumarylacetoacetate hydrolase family protein [Sphingomonas colocasiae]MBY8820756.1 fumarylacetoacetate hydrolase family protein [Sphingomonas colocasiae]
MKLATIRRGGSAVAAVVDEQAGRVFPLESDMISLIRSGERPALAGEGVALSSVELLAPIPRPPRNIFCVGKNYHAHAQEFTRSGFDSSARDASEAIPTAPIVFSKVPECVIASGEPIRYPTGVSDKLDYEAELAVVIGKGGRGIDRADAYDHVFGYMIVNDVTARDLQAHHKQWLIGKSLDTFCPMGPWLVTADDVSPETLGVRCWVNGELRQDANTADLIFDIPTLIEAISAGITLQPGDVIATGTPAGVGIGFDPPRYLARGDQVTIEIDGLGRLSNAIQ